jgi:hypothetical protein
MVSATRWAIRPSITTTPAVGPAVGPPSGAEVGAAVVGVVAANRPRVARRSTMGRNSRTEPHLQPPSGDGDIEAL